VVQDLKSQAGVLPRRALVTGATGFVGIALCDVLRQQNWDVRRALRTGSSLASIDDAMVGDIGPATDWRAALRDVDVVIHLAARTHVMRDTAADPLAAYRRLNVEGTQTLADAAQAAGVRRFIFLSSIKVNGEATTLRPFTENDAPQPEDAYGVSKWEAELALGAAAAGMETVVLRPPLLYGPGVKGNFLRLMLAIQRGIPLPLGSIHNHRSLLSLGNLVDAIMVCLDHPAAAGQTYLLADDKDPSTPELVRAISAALHKRARLIAFPPQLLKIAGAVTGKSAAVSRLLGSLQIDSSKIRGELGWQPRYALAEGLRQTAEWYYRMLAADIRT
jgi:nucleoside-diphosphate-sugar epimerase